MNKPDSDTLGQLLRGLPSSLKSPVMTQSPETLSEAAQMAIVAEAVEKESDTEEPKSLQSTVSSLVSGLKTLTGKIEDLKRRPTRDHPPLRPPQMMPGRLSPSPMAGQ